MLPVPHQKQEWVYIAKLAQQAQQYPDMLNFFKTMIERSATPSLNGQERNLLSVATKNVAYTRQTALRKLINMKCEKQRQRQRQIQTKGKNNDWRKIQLAIIQKEIQRESQDIQTLYTDMIKIIDKLLENQELKINIRVFYLFQKANYYKQMLNFSFQDRENLKNKCYLFFKLALEHSQYGLALWNPYRLRVILNLCVFLYEIMADTQQAIQIAKKGYSQACAEIENIGEMPQEDEEDWDQRGVEMLLGLIRDNLFLWIAEEEERNNQQQSNG